MGKIPQPAEGTAPGASKWAALFIVGSGIYMVTLDSGIVNVALPTIAREFEAPLVVVQWVILGYLVCITALLLPAGRLADMVGRRRVFLSGFLLFATGSALSGLAPSIGLLVAARVLQGVGAALVQANTDALVVTAFPAGQRGRALGMIGTIVSIGLLSGPVIGGAVTDFLGWRWAFYINVPIGVGATLLGRRLLPRVRPQAGQRPDPMGTGLLIVTVIALVLGLNRGPLSGWTSSLTVGLLLLALVGLTAFLLVQRRVASPTIQLALFRNRGVSAAVAAAWFGFLAQAHVRLLLPFYLQRLLNRPVAESGLILVTQPATVMVLAAFSGWLSDRLGSRWLASAGMALQVVGMIALSAVTADTSVPRVVANLILLGIATALFNSPNSNALYKAAPREHYGVLGGLRALTRNLGWVVGQGLAGGFWTAAIVAVAGSGPASEAPASVMAVGFRAAFLAAAALAAAATFISLVIRPPDFPRANPNQR